MPGILRHRSHFFGSFPRFPLTSVRGPFSLGIKCPPIFGDDDEELFRMIARRREVLYFPLRRQMGEER